MHEPLFVWLGSRRARRRGVGDKGRFLDEAASAGLPVPPGGILLDETYRLLLAERVIVLAADRVSVPDPGFLQDTIFNAIRFPRLESTAVVRTATSLSAAAAGEPAASTPTLLSVDPDKPEELATALSRVWTSILRAEKRSGVAAKLRRDVLIMKMVGVERKGEALTNPASIDDVVYYIPDDDHSPWQLPKLRRWRSPERKLPSFAQRLQQLLRGVRRTFGKRAWRVEWLDDGRICWLCQLEPVDSEDIAA